MAIPNRILMGAASVSAALAIGFVMQYGPQPQYQPAEVAVSVLPQAEAPKPEQEPARVASATAATDRIDLDAIALTVAAPIEEAAPAILPDQEGTVVYAAATPQLDISPVEETPVLDQPAASCDPDMTARSMPAAMVELSVEAPCLPQQRVTIHHNGMMFSAMTDADGKLTVQVPALAQSSVFIADFGNDMGAVAHSVVPDLAGFDRAVLQWQGDAGLHLHAMEFGAGFGQDGHVWAEQPGTVELALAGQGGFFTRLGDADLQDGHHAEIYTFPSGQAARVGDIALSADVEVTNGNCQKDLNAEALQLSRGGALAARELVLSMPQCDTVGDFLVLKNLLQDLKIAAN
ncbi:hypothetical protein [Thalassovita aquimarina]|uniref:Translocase n=1 Tax=Thalassovita aquimarina TaxID=2785917 RepID=A0ABS5HNE7_9RHOB|nr:hypothetical protein [Thalassovita aquimarina]MBR9650470.1 hypothetical protein [Thalassovita aquimarina]